MEEVREFFDFSTIHGLNHISSSKKWAKIFWILIVIGGFSGAIMLIHTSFLIWEQSPITTTVETLPISQLTLPNITVCPPMNTSLNLNYDILQSINRSLDLETREKMLEYTIEIIQENFFQEVMYNLSKLHEQKRYYNWYHGLTELRYPYYDQFSKQFYYRIETTASTGNCSTKHFKDNFDVDKVDENIFYYIHVGIPKSDKNTQLLYNIDRKTIYQYGENDKTFVGMVGYLKKDLEHFNKNITNPHASGWIWLNHNRDLTKDDIKSLDLKSMPGFRFTWKYDRKIRDWKKFENETFNKQFKRLLTFKILVPYINHN